MVINKYSQIGPAGSVSFARVAPPNPDKCITIATINQVTADQLVSFKAHVCHLSAVKHVFLNTGTTLRKQEAIVADPTASIEVVFREDSTEMVEEGNTYMFSNFHVKGNSGQQRYVNTPKAEKCSTEITQMFTEPLVKVENLPSLTRVEVDVNIIGVNSIEGCKMMQKLSNCANSWFLKLVIKADDSKSLHLLAYNLQDCFT